MPPRLIVAALVALLAIASSAGAATKAKPKPLRVHNGALVDAQGRTVVLHGVNVVYKPAPGASG